MKKDFLIITQFNTSGWEGHKALLERNAFASHIVCGQEHKLASSLLPSARAAIQKFGWDASLAPALDTGSASDTRFRSAGTYVAVKEHIGSQFICPCDRPDLSPKAAPGRMAGGWANVLGGLLVFSTYFRDSAGWNQENRSLVKQLGSVVAGLSTPWVAAMDANMPPEALAKEGEQKEAQLHHRRPSRWN